MLKTKIAVALAMLAVLLAGAWYVLTDGDEARLTEAQSTGREPVIGDPREEHIPTINLASIVGWQKDEKPVAAQGLVVERFADGLDHPRRLYRLPNGDILVAETQSPPRKGGGIYGWIQGLFMARAGAGGPSANRITLLRDANGDGRVETRSVFLSGLNSPYGMALVGNTFYVANADAIISFPYQEGQTRITAKPTKLINLPHNAPNEHWVRNLVASPDGRFLYVSIGSATNIADEGLDAENNRAAIFEIDLAKKDNRAFATGLRNPVGMAWDPWSKQLWTVVNERDQLGSDLVPDYLTSVSEGDFYGWPWNYWGGYEDLRVEPRRPEVRQYTRRPDYALGNHVAALGVTFSGDAKLGSAFAKGAFVGLHGSWNRKPAAGYKVVFVPFDAQNRPSGHPVAVLTGFLTEDGDARGRPVDVATDATGALLVSDDAGNAIWRVRAR